MVEGERNVGKQRIENIEEVRGGRNLGEWTGKRLKEMEKGEVEDYN